MRSISIVMTYYNRPQQLRNTLKSMQCFDDLSSPDIQLIIVDDASDDDQRAIPVLKEMHIPALVIDISKEQKTWINPSVPFNMGFALAEKEIVVIQNPECLHLWNVLSAIRCQIEENNYLTCSAYSLSQEQLNRISEIKTKPSVDWLLDVEKVVYPFNQNNWFHHPVYKPTWYHFTSAMTLKNLRNLGGFNEIFAGGYCFDDNEFLLRIRRSGLRVQDIRDPGVMVLHQWHPKNPALYGGCPLWERNRKIYLDILENK